MHGKSLALPIFDITIPDARLFDIGVVLLPGLTHEQLLSLRNEYKMNSTCRQGVRRDHTELLSMVHTVGILQQEFNCSTNKAINAAAALKIASPATVRSTLREYSATGAVTLVATSHRGSGGVDHPFHLSARQPTVDEEKVIDEEINIKVRVQGHYHSLTTLCATILERVNSVVCKTMLRRWLKQGGYGFEHKNYIGSLPPELKNALIRRFIYLLAKHRHDEIQGKTVLVFMDESYIHSSHNAKKAWMLINSPKGHDVNGTDGKGKRLMILHAMSRFGLLADCDDEDVNNNLTETFHTCAVVFTEVGVHNGDYHANFDGEKFIAWLTYRLLPTFKKMFPSKKMVLVLDNASYHSPPGRNTYQPSKMNAGHCISFFEARVSGHNGTITVPTGAGRVDMTLAQFSKSGRSGASVQKKKAAVRDYLKRHPGTSTSLTEDTMKQHNYELLFTPPYVPDLQPIEMLWARVKGDVARHATLKRKPAEAQAQTEAAFARVTANDCAALIDHIHKWINRYMQGANGGTLQQFADFAALVRQQSSSVLPSDTAANEDDHSSSDEEEDE